jgi:hypothetical protein
VATPVPQPTSATSAIDAAIVRAFAVATLTSK